MQKVILATALLAAISAPAMATGLGEAGSWTFRAGVAHVAPNDDSGRLNVVESVIGAQPATVSVDTGTALGLTGTYHFTDNVALEVLAASPFNHDIKAGGALGGTLQSVGLGTKIGEARHLPPTVSLQYWFGQSSDTVRPYVGAGLNYTTFLKDSASDDLRTALQALGVTGPNDGVDLDLDDSFGLAAQAGFDVALNESWSLNAALWYVDIDTEADVLVNRTTIDSVDVEIDPFAVMVGVGWRF